MYSLEQKQLAVQTYDELYHYRKTIQVEDTMARKWYEKEAYEQVWGYEALSRRLQRSFTKSGQL